VLESFVTGARAIWLSRTFQAWGGGRYRLKMFLKPGLASFAAVASNNQLRSAAQDRPGEEKAVGWEVARRTPSNGNAISVDLLAQPAL
jgi:hypothetical protein